MNSLTMYIKERNKTVLILFSVLISIFLGAFLSFVAYKSFLIGVGMFAVILLGSIMLLLLNFSGIKKTLIILFFFTLAFNIEFPLYPFNGGFSASHPGGLRGALVINQFFLILLALFPVFLREVTDKHLASHRQLSSLEIVLFVSFTLVSIISFFFADNKPAASYTVVRLIFMTLFVFMMLKLNFSSIWDFFLKGVILLLPVQFGIGITQYITGQYAGFRILGESKNPFRAETVFGAAEKGLSGTLGHPGILGAFLTLIMPFLLLYYLNSEKKTKIRSSLVFFSILLCASLIILTNARTSIVIMLATFFLGFVGTAIIRYRTDEPANKLLWYLSIFTLAILTFVFVFSDALIERFGDSDLLYQASYRGNLSVISWSIITDNFKNFFLGVGPNNYTDTVATMGSGFAYTQPVHNMYLLLFAEGGIFFALCYVSLLGTVLFKMTTVIVQKGKHSYYALAVAISIINIFLYNFTGWANNNNQTFILFVIICIFSIKIYEEHKQTRLGQL
ncbi:O-antigen ligase family protein [Priestia megaterium]|uniref:O-antigen ligase family protein n=1 Tax=Priestia megaterium TaxID=1404 RepID=UPI0025A40862|nr:O-antigen ligase family protein [Priestia megaterium]MDM8147830.1 O-antigen ligase family protein [Priestia megaterium]